VAVEGEIPLVLEVQVTQVVLVLLVVIMTLDQEL
jgi:hypothetical protein